MVNPHDFKIQSLKCNAVFNIKTYWRNRTDLDWYCCYVKVLVTFSEGLIGSHLLEDSVMHGHHVFCSVHNTSFNSHGRPEAINKPVKTPPPIQPPKSRGGIP